MHMKEYIVINKKDSVGVALTPLEKGKVLNIKNKNLILTDDIPQGHKFALISIKSGEDVLKYGEPIGKAVTDILPGEWVHTHNLKTGLGEVITYTYKPVNAEIKKRGITFFDGYERKDGSVGVRNDIWIIPTVGCVNAITKVLQEEGKNYLTENIDDILAFPHPYGCSQMGEDQENTRKVLADMINHPNAGGVLVLGLGCENSNIEVLKEYIGEYDESRVKFLQCQDVEDEIEEGKNLLHELIGYADQQKRSTCDISKLIVGMKCGGSDGLSGITANPLVGAFSDRLIAAGGTTILTEVPEMFGAETILMNRCTDEKIFNKTVEMINGFKDYYISNNQTIYENPSPGNKKGGISTLEDKSLGCTQKSGMAPVVDVLKYAERVEKLGLNLLEAPGNDLIAATALAISGAQIVLFTTGRGTPFSTMVPTVKIASNSSLAKNKSDWIDFNAGVLVENQEIDEVSEELFEYIVKIASGEKIKSEVGHYQDFAIFKQGVTL